MLAVASSPALCLETLALVTETDASGMTFPCEFRTMPVRVALSFGGTCIEIEPAASVLRRTFELSCFNHSSNRHVQKR